MSNIDGLIKANFYCINKIKLNKSIKNKKYKLFKMNKYFKTISQTYNITL